MSKKNRNKINAIRDQVAQAPSGPGVYLFVDGHQNILYVGKAKNIRKRLQQHFADPVMRREPQKASLLERMAEVQWFPTPTEDDAFFVENQYIKKYQPVFNVLLRDDKTFPYLRVSLSHPFPKLSLSRRVVPGQDVFMGPFRSGALIRQMMDICTALFKIRSCTDHFFRVTKRPCMEYQLKRCRAPCVGYEDQGHYNEEVARMMLFLSGREKTVLKTLKHQMEQLSKQEQFAEAAQIRDNLRSIETFLESSKAEFTGVAGHSDFIAIEGKRVGILHVRFGVISGITVPEIEPSSPFQTAEEVMENILLYYGTRLVVPDKIYFPCELTHKKTAQELIFRQGGLRPRLVTPKKVQERQLMNFLVGQVKSGSIPGQKRLSFRKSPVPASLGSELRDFCRLDREPKRFEAIDISHFQGMYTVGAVVVFDGRGPLKDQYRYYKIAAPEGKLSAVNDTAAIAQVCERRYGKLSSVSLPDVLLIDGGRGQLNAASRVIHSLGLDAQIRVLSLSKNRKPQGTDRIHFNFSAKPIGLPATHPVYRFLTWMRDESHRFCNAYQKRKFQKALRSLGKDV